MSYDSDIAPQSHKLKVIKSLWQDFPNMYSVCDFLCETECGKTVRIDLLTCGSLPEDIDPMSLVGKTVQVGWSYGYLFIGEDVSIVG